MVENVESGGERYRSSGGHMCCPVPDQLVSRLAHYICGRHLPSLMSYLGAMHGLLLKPPILIPKSKNTGLLKKLEISSSSLVIHWYPF